MVLFLSRLSAGLHASNSCPNGIGLFDQFDEHHAARDIDMRAIAMARKS
jgi:hypothetical protein